MIKFTYLCLRRNAQNGKRQNKKSHFESLKIKFYWLGLCSASLAYMRPRMVLNKEIQIKKLKNQHLQRLRVQHVLSCRDSLLLRDFVTSFLIILVRNRPSKTKTVILDLSQYVPKFELRPTASSTDLDSWSRYFIRTHWRIFDHRMSRQEDLETLDVYFQFL